jgi:hypothetical protein
MNEVHSGMVTHAFQHFDDPLAGLCAYAQPVAYSVHTPSNHAHAVHVAVMRVIDAQQLLGFGVPSLGVVDGNDVEDFAVFGAMHGQAQTDGHSDRMRADGRRSALPTLCSPKIRDT